VIEAGAPPPSGDRRSSATPEFLQQFGLTSPRAAQARSSHDRPSGSAARRSGCGNRSRWGRAASHQNGPMIR
jgi:hypothetical protein